MPYIDKDRRVELEGGADPETAGELTYLITREVDHYILSQGKSFASLSDGVGALECAKLELYARVLRPYEDGKLLLNGDVYRSAHN